MLVKIITTLLFVFMIVMNYLANALPLNGKTTGELSDAYPNLFVPAGITFSIWGVIYLLLALYVVLQFFPAYSKVATDIGWLFTISSLFNGLWIVAWHYQRLPLSLLVMAGMLLTLLLINQRITGLNYDWVKAAFGIYLGWICIASIANVTAVLVNYNWNGWGISEQSWTLIMMTVGMLIGIITLLKMNNPFVGLSVAWAFAGIAIKRQSDYRLIMGAAIVMSFLVLAVFIYQLFFSSRLVNA